MLRKRLGPASASAHRIFNTTFPRTPPASWTSRTEARYLISAIRMMMGIGTPSSHNKTERMIAS